MTNVLKVRLVVPEYYESDDRSEKLTRDLK